MTKITPNSLLTESEREGGKDILLHMYKLRACPPEDQAEVIHAISPISVKLGQIEGHTQ